MMVFHRLRHFFLDVIQYVRVLVERLFANCIAKLKLCVDFTNFYVTEFTKCCDIFVTRVFLVFNYLYL